MIRFQPDTLLQAFTRFFDMAAPDANVYVEIAAPDIRMALVVVFALAALASWNRLGSGRTPTFALLLFLLVAGVPWLLTTGNGRYFIPVLMCAGPILLGLVAMLPATRTLKAVLILVAIVGQLFVLREQPPWNQWAWLQWREPPYFSISLGQAETSETPTTYVSLSPISYSLIAPQFPPHTRWISASAGNATPRDESWVLDYLQTSASLGPLRLIVPSLPSKTLANGTPGPEVLQVLDKLIAHRNLRINADCHLIASAGLAKTGVREGDLQQAQLPPIGFWSCPLVYDERLVQRSQRQTPSDGTNRMFAHLEQLCPRYFRPTEGSTIRIEDGWVRVYAGSDTRVYVMDNGTVGYKFWRSLNPVLLGQAGALLAGHVTVDCSQVRGTDGAWTK